MFFPKIIDKGSMMLSNNPGVFGFHFIFIDKFSWEIFPVGVLFYVPVYLTSPSLCASKKLSFRRLNGPLVFVIEKEYLLRTCSFRSI